MSDKNFYSLIADELENDNTDRALWTRALGESGGDPDKTKACYVRLRLAELKEAESAAGQHAHRATAVGGDASVADNGLMSLRGKLAEALDTSKISSFYSVLGLTPQATDAAVAAAISTMEARIDSGTASSTPEFKYAKETLGNARARETYDRRLFERFTNSVSPEQGIFSNNHDQRAASANALLTIWETRKTSVIVGVLALVVIGYMVLGFYKEREASAARKKALDVQILQTNKAAEIAATRAETERTLVEGALQGDEQRIRAQEQVANRVVSIQESAESRQSRELELRANTDAEILRQQEHRLKIAEEQLKWERSQREQAVAAQQSRDRVASDKREIFRLMMSEGRISEARIYAQNSQENAQVDAAERSVQRAAAERAAAERAAAERLAAENNAKQREANRARTACRTTSFSVNGAYTGTTVCR
jgi:hypothetical protein